MKIKCIIVDDEPIARQIIESYCAYLADMDIIASCGDGLQAKSILEKHSIDLIFLDINLPVLNGMAFARTLRTAPQIIFTTAYKEFAHEAFDLNACDYLLKPFSLERFIVAVDKAKDKLLIDNNFTTEQASESCTYIKSEGKIYKIDFETLNYAEACGNYIKIVTDDRQLMPAMTLSNFEEILPKSSFIRVHRSFIINKSKIQVVEGNRIMIGSQEIPIGANYRELFLKSIRMS